MTKQYTTVGSNYKNTSDVPKAADMSYLCLDCGDIIPSIPKENIGCKCGNIFIDKDCWRLIIVDLTKLEAIKVNNNSNKLE